MSDGLMNSSRNCSARARARELGALVGDGDEVIGPAGDRRRPRAAAGSAPPANSARSSCPTCWRGCTACGPAVSPRRRTAAGSVESSMCRRGQPGATPRTARSTSGARLEPPIPSSTTSVKPLRDAGGEGSQPFDGVGHQERRRHPAQSIRRPPSGSPGRDSRWWDRVATDRSRRGQRRPPSWKRRR